MKFLQTYKLFEKTSIDIGDDALCIDASSSNHQLENGNIYKIEKTKQSFGLQIKLVGVDGFWEHDRFIFDEDKILNYTTKKYNI